MLRTPSTLRASVRFAAALCEIGGSFLIFASRCASGTTVNDLRLSLGSVAPDPPSPLTAPMLGVTAATKIAMKIARFTGHHEAREALVLSIAGVTAIMLIEGLVLVIWY